MNIRTLLCCALCLGACLAPARAGDFELFSGAWKYGLGGQITQGSSAISLDHDRGVRADGQALVLLRYRGGGHWMPDLGAGYVHFGADGSYVAPSNLQFGNIVLIKDQTVVRAGINLNSFDTSADWRVLDTSVLHLGAGLGLKYLAGHATVGGVNNIGLPFVSIGIPLIQQQRFSVDKWVPLLMRASMRTHGAGCASPWWAAIPLTPATTSARCGRPPTSRYSSRSPSPSATRKSFTA